MNIIGKKYVADFGMAKAILHFQENTSLTFTITEKDGKPVNIVETVIVNITEIRPALFIITWKELSGTTVVQVHDYEKNIIYSNWTSREGDIQQVKGKLIPVVVLTVQTTIRASIESCWRLWSTPADIVQFNNPFDDWHTARVEIDLRTGGRFYYRMEAKDGSTGFDFAGTYDKVIRHSLIECTGDDGRKTINTFTSDGVYTSITEDFEPDTTTPLEIQQVFCQTILDNFKKYAENEAIRNPS